jgi:nitrite reductase (NO-forming)
MSVSSARPASLLRRSSVALALAWLAATALGCGEEPATPAVLVAKDPLDLPPPITRTTAETVEISLTAKEVVGLLDDGTKASVWTFDGTVPGPLIRVRRGDDVVLRLTNDPSNAEPHSIDLHAVVGPGGGSVATEVAPGESAELRFRADVAGAFFYHCSAENMPSEHVAHGMFGAILVEPEGGLPPVAREIYLVQNEWYLKHRYEGAHDEEAEEHEGASEQPADVLVLDERAAELEQPRFFTFNGHVRALRSPALFGDRVHVEQGGRVRIFFANAGPNLASSFHVMGEIFDRVWTGSFDAPLVDEETVLVPPGSAAVLELATPVPGMYSVMDHALFHADRGAMGDLHVDAPGDGAGGHGGM